MRGGSVRKLFVLAVIAAVLAAVVKALRGRAAPQFSNHPSVNGGADARPGAAPVQTMTVAAPEPGPEAAPEPEPTPAPATAAPAAAVADQTWVAAIDGACPDGFPVKAKTKSKIFHQPGGLAYERTNPDRCYPDAAAAEADGFRAAKR